MRAPSSRISVVLPPPQALENPEMRPGEARRPSRRRERGCGVGETPGEEERLRGNPGGSPLVGGCPLGRPAVELGVPVGWRRLEGAPRAGGSPELRAGWRRAGAERSRVLQPPRSREPGQHPPFSRRDVSGATLKGPGRLPRVEVGGLWWASGAGWEWRIPG